MFVDAESLAREYGEVDLADRAFCNRCSVLVELDQGADQIPKLKEILLSSSDTRNRFLAAYNTGVAYFISEDFERAHSYARRATTLAGELRDPSSRTRASTSSAPWRHEHRSLTRPRMHSCGASMRTKTAKATSGSWPPRSKTTSATS